MGPQPLAVCLHCRLVPALSRRCHNAVPMRSYFGEGALCPPLPGRT